MAGKRKYVSEFSVGITSEGWLMITPDQLHADGKMREEHQIISDSCHIYMICKRPKATCSPGTPTLEDGYLSGSIISRVSGEEVLSEYCFPFEFEEEECEIKVAPYPHRKIYTINSDGEEVRFWPSDIIALHTGSKIYFELEVLYVGQAYAEGKRTAIDRLKSHSTLQKILAETMYDYPDDQVFIVMVQYDNYFLTSSFSGRDKEAIAGEEDNLRLKSIISNPLSLKEIICLSEAALIRYFQPKYNEIYKNNFPSLNQKVLSVCFGLDFSGLSVEIELCDSPFELYSDGIKARHHHTAAFNLVDESERLGFFTFSNGVDIPKTMDGTISMKK